MHRLQFCLELGTLPLDLAQFAREALDLVLVLGLFDLFVRRVHASKFSDLVVDFFRLPLELGLKPLGLKLDAGGLVSLALNLLLKRAS